MKIGMGLSVCRGGNRWNPLRLSNLAGWWDAADAGTLFEDTSALAPVSNNSPVARWNDKSGNGRHFTQPAGGTARPTWQTALQKGLAGLVFDGSNDFMETASFALAQPVVYYLATKQVTWTTAERMLDGTTVDRCVLAQLPSTPQLQIYAGTFTCTNGDLAVGTFGILRAVFNGASSSLRVNSGSPATANAGSTGLTDGITIGAKYDGSTPANIHVGELVALSATLAAADETALMAYLTDRWVS